MPGIIGRNTFTTEVVANFPNYPVCNVATADLYTAVAGDVIDQFGLYARDYYGTTGNIDVGAYVITAGVVGARVGYANIAVPGATAGWHLSASGLGISLTAGLQYCISMVDTLNPSARLFYFVVTNSRDNGNVGASLPNPWVHNNYTNGSFLAYANVIAGAAPSSPAGRPGIPLDPLFGDF